LITSRKTRVLLFPGHLELHANAIEGEKARITAAGGFVDFGRVNGNLALSRAIGDFEFKKSAELAPEQQIVTAFPDVTVHDISDDDEFLVVACDGQYIYPFGPILLAKQYIRRHLGLPVFSSSSRICATRYCCKARSFEDM
jgi:protein phosphatase 2C family protein 2/3